MEGHEPDEPEVAVPAVSLAGLTGRRPEQAMERHRTVRAFLEDGTPLTVIAHRENQPLRTLRRWVKSYRSDGLVGLATQNRNDSGRRRRVSEETEQLVEGPALKRLPLPIRWIHRQVGAIASRHGQPIPSFTRIHLKHVTRSIVEAVREGLVIGSA